MRNKKSKTENNKTLKEYLLDDQVGFILRKANQRHASIFSNLIPNDLTPTKFSALAKLYELGSLSQNELGRFIAMDAANMKSVIDRLKRLNLVRTRTDPNDGRRHLIDLTPLGKVIIERSIPKASLVTEKTLSPLSEEEQVIFLSLLQKISSLA
jgi:DNA-binding MarR family transcriptional regulator